MLELSNNYFRLIFRIQVKNPIFVLAFTILLLVPSITLGQNEYSYVKKWGSQGAGEGQFTRPSNIAADFSGNFSSNDIYVIDSGNSRIVKFANNGTFLGKWGSQGAGDGQFNLPSGIAIDPVGNVYVLDSGNSRIQKFDSEGNFLGKWGSQGAAEGQFSKPVAIAVDSTGSVYVVNAGNSIIQKFAEDGSYITSWGSRGASDGQMNNPSGITTDSTGNVYVADSGNSRIEVFAFTPPA